MASYAWPDAPASTRAQVADLLRRLQDSIGSNLSGLYLHGSLAMGCFNPARSDLDLLAVTTEEMAVETKRAVILALLERSRAPHPIEISFLRHSDLALWRFPTPFDLHYSETWRARYQEELASGAWRRWSERERTDSDLAAHITIVRERGVRLFGPDIAGVFPAVPRADYLAAILDDYTTARDRIAQDPVYGILNLCRVYRYLFDGHIDSKEEGGTWALRHVPTTLRPIVQRALTLYSSTGTDKAFAPADLTAFAHYIDERMCARIVAQNGR